MISKALIDLYINHDEFISVNNVVREYNEMKEKMKNPENNVEYIYKNIIYKIIYNIISKYNKIIYKNNVNMLSQL